MPWWEEWIPESDREIYRQANFGGEPQWGNRPALVIVDALWSFIGSRPVDVLEAIKEYPTACGKAGWDGMERIAAALAVFRRKDLPVVYVCASGGLAARHGSTTRRAKRDPVLDARAYEIPEPIAPREGEPVVVKSKASGFFRTPLDVLLRRDGVDTVLIAGSTTCGCIRASTVDAHSLGFNTFVLEDAVWDRSPFSHAVSLFELNMKYAHVLPVEAAMAEIGARYTASAPV